jgi:hypothetical protein
MVGRRRQAIVRGLFLFALAGGFSVAIQGTALAACHQFNVSVNPSSVTEGGKVAVTVTRDGGFAASNIDVSTVDETAKAGKDYTAVHQTIQFANNTSDLSRSFQVATINNSIHETTETFRVHLSNPGGCAINPNFDVGPDARVTIKDNDAAPAPTPTASKTSKATATAAAEPEARETSRSPTPSAKPSPRASRSSAIPSAPSSSSPSVAAAAAREGGSSRGLLIAIVVAVVIAGSAAIGVKSLRSRNRS